MPRKDRTWNVHRSLLMLDDFRPNFSYLWSGNWRRRDIYCFRYGYLSVLRWSTGRGIALL